MKAEIIAIGTEILLGRIVNTNAAYLSRKLAELGIDVYHHQTVGDNPARLAEAIRKAALRAEIIITTGGLGPTVDDITAATLSMITGRRLIPEKAILRDMKAYFKLRGRVMPPDNARQALVPEGAEWIRNLVGTAPGIIAPWRGRTVMALPGPPGELVPMFEKDIAPYIRKKFKPGCVFRTRTVKMTGLPESCVNNSVKDLLKLEPPTTVGIYAKPGEVDLVIMSKAKSASAASRAILKVEKKIKSRLKGHIFGYDDETLESAVGSMLIRKSMTIAVAESCTGGLISSRLTDVSGSSRYFIRGAVPYANEVKIKHVGVSEKTLSRYGAVSRQVALEMATGLKSLMRVDVCLGVTGIAGPTGGSADKPVGLVYIAIDAPRRRAVKKFMFKGSRSDIKFQASQAALDLIRKNI